MNLSEKSTTNCSTQNKIEQQINSIYMNESVFKCILGPPGTGKSQTIETFIEKDSSYGIKCSSTGRSALNIGGRTIHSTLGYFNTESLYHKVASGDIYKNLQTISNRYQNIIIDEVSALPGKQIDYICWSLQNFNKGKSANDKLGLLLTGDAGQLPPVDGNSFIECKYWDYFQVVHLQKIYRQTDEEFIKALMKIRLGKVLETLDYFDSVVHFFPKLMKGFPGLTFMTTNKMVTSFNNFVISGITSPQKHYEAVLEGEKKSEWKEILQGITLKIGCQIMIVCNNNIEGYVNGDVGVITDLMNTGVWVTLFRNGQSYFITRISHINLDLKNKEIGRIEFLPIKIAYATTVNKCQGLTLDNAQIYLKEGFFSQLSGGLSVALSRVRAKEGLRLVGSREDFVRCCYLNEKFKPLVLASTADTYL
jgi:hypothetical protein